MTQNSFGGSFSKYVLKATWAVLQRWKNFCLPSGQVRFGRKGQTFRPIWPWLAVHRCDASFFQFFIEQPRACPFSLQLQFWRVAPLFSKWDEERTAAAAANAWTCVQPRFDAQKTASAFKISLENNPPIWIHFEAEPQPCPHGVPKFMWFEVNFVY